jgi:hypothetical protein
MAAVQVKITIGKKSNCLLLAMTESELFNNNQLRLNLFMLILSPAVILAPAHTRKAHTRPDLPLQNRRGFRTGTRITEPLEFDSRSGGGLLAAYPGTPAGMVFPVSPNHFLVVLRF